MTKEEFKTRWESDADGGGITLDEVAQCAIEWGIASHPRTMPIDKVISLVCEAAGVKED